MFLIIWHFAHFSIVHPLNTATASLSQRLRVGRFRRGFGGFTWGFSGNFLRRSLCCFFILDISVDGLGKIPLACALLQSLRLTRLLHLAHPSSMHCHDEEKELLAKKIANKCLNIIKQKAPILSTRKDRAENGSSEFLFHKPRQITDRKPPPRF